MVCSSKLVLRIFAKQHLIFLVIRHELFEVKGSIRLFGQ